MEKFADNVYQKWLKDLYLVLVNNLKYNWHIQETVVNKIFWKTIIKNLQKNHLDFFTSSVFYGDCYEKQKGPETRY